MAMVLLAAEAISPQTVEAQTVEAPARVDATPKGTIGLGLIGAELGLVIPAVCGLDKTWSLILFPALGAGAGATAGYFAIDEPGRAKGAVTVLAIGIGLVIPAAVWTLVATAYDPRKDTLPKDTLPKDRTSASASAANHRAVPSQGRARRTELSTADTGLLRMHRRSMAMGLPAVSMLPAYTAQEVQQYGAKQIARLHVPVVSGRF